MLSHTILFCAIVILMTIAYFIEAHHDFAVEHLYNDSKSELWFVRQWHKLDWYFHSVVAITISISFFNVTMHAVLFAMFLGLLRSFVLNSTLNIIKHKSIWYLGSTSKYDIFLKRFEKPYFVFLITSIILIVTYFIHILTC